jgi:hypothetical protein
MICCNSDCKKEIEDGERYKSSNYGDFCSFMCWFEVAKDVVGYGDEIRDIAEEKREKEEREKRSLAFRNLPKWGDDL